MDALERYSADLGRGSDVLFQMRMGQDLTAHNAAFYSRRARFDGDWETADSGYYSK